MNNNLDRFSREEVTSALALATAQCQRQGFCADANANSTSKPTIAIHPLDLVPTDWVTARQYISLHGLTVEIGVQSPHQIEARFTHHVLGILTSDENQQEILRIGDEEYDGRFDRGTGFIVPAEIDYFSAWKSTDTGINFTFDPAFLTQIADRDLEIDRSKTELLCRPFVRDPQLTAIANLFQHEIETGGMGGTLYAESLRNILSVHLLRHYSAFTSRSPLPISSLSSIQLDRILDYIETHLSQTIHLANLAAIVRISESHFSRSFKQSTGTTPHQYVLKRRVERAKQLLLKSQLSILEVALECGFAHPGHLSRHFKRIVGTTPNKFRQQ
jgi:AraC family transcriptional regulator